VLPDTQFYSQRAEWTYHFEAQTRWTVEHIDEWDIAFLSHVGDIVQNGSQTAEWQRADAAMDRLDGALPYAAVIGNHDWASTGNKDASTANYLANFGPHRYAGRPWYVGSDARGLNHAQLFEGGGRTFLHLTLEWRPDWKSEALAWAQSVIDAHPGVPTIISSHEHLTDAHGGHRSASGENVFNRLVRSNDQVFMVLNGHYTTGAEFGEHYEVHLNDYGRPVFEMLADFQRRPEGGDGWLRLLEFLPEDNRLEVHTFSPSREDRGLSAWETDAGSRFGFDLDFDERFSPPVDPVPFREITIRQGSGGFARAVDTTLREADPFRQFYRDERLWIDGDDPQDTGLDTHGLVRFEELVGPGGLPAGADVLGAVLEFEVDNGGSGIGLHRTLAGWSNVSTWSSLGNGVQADGVEAWSREEATLSSINDGTLSIDVTASVRSQLAGGPETGWALLPLGNDGVGLASGEAPDEMLRPRLRVRYTEAPVKTATFREGVNGYAGTRDTDVRAINADSSFGEEPTALVDAQHNFFRTNALLRFDGVIGAGGVPGGPDTRITSALLRLTVTEPGSGLTLHRVRRAWDEEDTWNTLVGGIRADGEEADAYPVGRAGRDDSGTNVGSGVYTFDVTADLLRWLSGEPNHGWALLPWPSGTDGLEFATSESPVIADRPELIVRYTGTCPSDFNADGSVNTQDVLAFLNAWNDGLAGADFNHDGTVNTQDVLAFLNAWASGC
ncbi:MAG: DNRLRE domain-containing protein, partial [Phycisphaerales bacterium JB041]